LQIAVNEARLKRRSKHANPFEPLDGTQSSSGEPFMPRDFTDWRELPSDIAERKEIKEQITRALHMLPETNGEITLDENHCSGDRDVVAGECCAGG
jgi:hypothetical protein